MNAVMKPEVPTRDGLQAQRLWHENREQMIRTEAYYCAERRGFEPGHELEDWLDAEHQTDERLLGEGQVI